MNPNLIELSQVNKFLGNRCILKGGDLVIPPSKVLQITGANGAGKSTLLRIIAGLLDVESGHVLRANHLKVAYQGHELGLYEDLTVGENLGLFQQLSGASSSSLEIVNTWQLSELLERRVSSLSRGQAWRVALAISFSQSADLIILDEPTANLDRSFVQLLIGNICEYREKFPSSSFVLATHEALEIINTETTFVKLESAQLKIYSPQGSGSLVQC
jgi:ABC-type transport system involved in cytochrome c biogenesis ATPase subunit